MIDYFRQLYIEHLVGPMNEGTGHERPRVRNIESWKRIESRLPHGTELDLENLEDYRRIWVWSDHHFGHKNIIRFSDRPYVDLEQMREQMVLNYQDYVKPDDVCIWVGDFAFLNDAKANEILHRMTAYNILIVGNHDIEKRKVKKLHFDETHLCKYLRVGGLDFVFTHYPMHNLPEPYFNIHGHEHISHATTNTPQHFNVNVEMIGYKPKLFQDIVDQAEMRKEDMNGN